MKRCPCGANAVDGMSHCSVGCMQRDAWWRSQHEDVRPCGCHGSGLCSRCAPRDRAGQLLHDALDEMVPPRAPAPAFKFQRGPIIRYSEED